MKRKCDACADGPLAGILNNGERCDACERYPSDHDAVLALVAYTHKAREALKQNMEWLEAFKDNEPEDYHDPKFEAVIRKSRKLIRKWAK